MRNCLPRWMIYIEPSHPALDQLDRQNYLTAEQHLTGGCFIGSGAPAFCTQRRAGL